MAQCTISEGAAGREVLPKHSPNLHQRSAALAASNMPNAMKNDDSKI
jgi:hypothetical protein